MTCGRTDFNLSRSRELDDRNFDNDNDKVNNDNNNDYRVRPLVLESRIPIRGGGETEVLSDLTRETSSVSFTHWPGLTHIGLGRIYTRGFINNVVIIIIILSR